MKWSLYILSNFLTINSVLSWEWFNSAVDSVLGERCIDRWLPSDVNGLKADFKNHIFGQPFLEGALVPLLKRHLGVGLPESSIPKKALALSFHGSPGIGKTYVSHFIAKHLFKNGEKSIFYKHITLGQSWEMDEKSLRALVIDTVSQCGRAVFVFDEIDKMPEGILEALKSFLDFYNNVGNVDYRKSIFIFISNIGAERINSLALSLWKKGINRKDYKLSDFTKALQDSVYNEQSGLKKTKIVKNFLIDLYLPFLPLEKRHIEECIYAEAKKINVGITHSVVKTVLDSMSFLPDDEQIFSPSGCKDVIALIKIYGHDEL